MAHGILGNSYAGELDAWHRLGTVWGDRKVTLGEAIDLAGARFPVHKQPMYTRFNDEEYEIDDYVGLFRPSIPADPQTRFFGMVSSNYEPLVADDVEKILGPLSEVWRPSTVGVLDYGERTFYCLDMGRTMLCGEEQQDYLTLTNGNDGKTGTHILVSKTRVVCNNTWRLAHDDATIKVSLNHYQGIKDDLEWTSQLILQVRQANDRIAQRITQLSQLRLKADQVEHLLVATYPTPPLPAQLKQAKALVSSETQLTGDVMEKLDKIRKAYESRCEGALKDRLVAGHSYSTFNDTVENRDLARTGYAFLNAVSGKECHQLGAKTTPESVAKSVLYGPRGATMQLAANAVEKLLVAA